MLISNLSGYDSFQLKRADLLLLRVKRSATLITSVLFAVTTHSCQMLFVLLFLAANLLSSLLLPPGQRVGASGDRLPGLPVGSHPDQLPPHHHRHPWPVWHDSVQAEICYWGEFYTISCTHTLT